MRVGREPRDPPPPSRPRPSRPAGSAATLHAADRPPKQPAARARQPTPPTPKATTGRLLVELDQLGEQRSQRVHASLALQGSSKARSAPGVLLDRADLTDREITDVRLAAALDSPSQAKLDRSTVGFKAHQHRAARGKRATRGLPRLQEPPVVRKQEPAHTSLQIQQQRLRLVSTRDLLLSPRLRPHVPTQSGSRVALSKEKRQQQDSHRDPG